MKPLWLELLMVPMAAPETRWLRAMRTTLVASLLLVAAGIANLSTIERETGRVGLAMLAGLCVALAALVTIYVATKTRADDRYLAQLRDDDA